MYTRPSHPSHPFPTSSLLTCSLTYPPPPPPPPPRTQTKAEELDEEDEEMREQVNTFKVRGVMHEFIRAHRDRGEAEKGREGCACWSRLTFFSPTPLTPHNAPTPLAPSEHDGDVARHRPRRQRVARHRYSHIYVCVQCIYVIGLTWRRSEMCSPTTEKTCARRGPLGLASAVATRPAQDRGPASRRHQQRRPQGRHSFTNICMLLLHRLTFLLPSLPAPFPSPGKKDHNTDK